MLTALNRLGPAHRHEKPNAADSGFSRRVKQWQHETSASEVEATFFQILQEVENPGAEVKSLIDGARRGVLRVGDDPKSIWLAEFAERLYGPEGPRVVSARSL